MSHAFAVVPEILVHAYGLLTWKNKWALGLVLYLRRMYMSGQVVLSISWPDGMCVGCSMGILLGRGVGSPSLSHDCVALACMMYSVMAGTLYGGRGG